MKTSKKLKIAADAGLNIHELCLLLLMAENPQLQLQRFTFIAEDIGFSKASLTQAVDKLEKLNLAVREKMLFDRRVHRIHLTDKGKNFLKKLEYL